MLVKVKYKKIALINQINEFIRYIQVFKTR